MLHLICSPVARKLCRLLVSALLGAMALPLFAFALFSVDARVLPADSHSLAAVPPDAVPLSFSVDDVSPQANVAASDDPLVLIWSSLETDYTMSVAWGDVDGDGDLDLAVGNDSEPNRLYHNDNGMLTPSAVYSTTEADRTSSVAWGDYDGDGDLDLAVGNNGLSRLYRNDHGTLTARSVYTTSGLSDTRSVAWGDVDGDGDLDLALGNGSFPNRLYRNDDGVLTPSPVWLSTDTAHTTSLAWGDVDGDGDLDLAVGNGCSGLPSVCYPNWLYRNDEGVLTTSPVYSTTEAEDTRSVAWSDVDSDGDLDLTVGNYGQRNRFYRNDNGTLFPSAGWSSAEVDNTTSMAWGDYDADGDLDLAVGNYNQPNRLYRNDGVSGGVLQMMLVWTAQVADNTRSVAWGDVDGDGDLDLAVGNIGPNRVYRNDSGFVPRAVYSTTEADNTTSVAWGDVDGDGDLDLAVGNYGQPNRLYRNDNGMLTLSASYSTTEADETVSVVWGDYDGDGDLDLAVGNDGLSRLYRNDHGQLTPGAVYTISGGYSEAKSMAWGDVDGDGDLDLAVGINDQPSRLYRNDDGVLTPNPVWLPTEDDNTTSVAWGDVDGDGDLDLAVGNLGRPNRLYRNDQGMLTPSAVWSSTEADRTYSIAWGDVDGDGDLDLAVGNYDLQPKRLYRNDDGVLTPSAAWSSVEADNTRSVAWGDYDGDGDLDLAAGNYAQPNRLYRNDNGMLTPSAVWSSTEADNTRSVAWGDVDGDGDLDLAAGNYGQPNRLYLNHRDAQGLPGSIPTLRIRRPVAEANGYAMSGTLSNRIVFTYTLSDEEGDPAQWVRVWYAMDGGGRGVGGDQWKPALSPSGTHFVTVTPPVGIFDDFDPTLRNGQWSKISGGAATISQCGSLSGRGFSFNSAAGITRSAATRSLNVTAGGYIYFALKFGTGALASGCENADAGEDVQLEYSINEGQSWTAIATYDTEVYTTFTLISVTIPAPARTPVTQFRWRQLYNSGDRFDNWALDNVNIVPNRLVADGFDPVADVSQWSLSGHVITTGLCGGRAGNGLNFNGATGITRSATTNALDVRSGGKVHFTLRMGDDSPGCEAPESTDYVMLEYSTDNGLNWTPVQTYSQSSYLTFTAVSLAIPPAASTGATRFRWRQALHSGVGNDIWSLDNVHIMAVPTSLYTFDWDVNRSGLFGRSDNVVLRMEAVPAVYNATNSIPGPYLYGSFASSTFPLRVRGTQVRVLSSTKPVSNALVYQLQAGHLLGALPLSNPAGVPYRTDGQGYLQGRGVISPSDQLAALLPISATSSYTLYYSSAAPKTTGLSMYIVPIAARGIHTLTVSSARPLILFDLKASLEWDARQDTAYLDQLEFNLRRASEVLFDVTNGQVALGQVAVYHNRQEWNNAHIRIYANNQLRPFASQGGLVSGIITDPITSTVIYLPGQVNIGATWNRYGNAGVMLGEDWPRTLAHELGHYALYLDDNYLGLTAGGLLTPTSSCTGTIMTDSYRDDYSELRQPTNWLPACENTLSNRSTGRSDWATVDTFYPALYINVNAGPSSLPLAVTQVRFVEPPSPVETLPDPRFYLIYNGTSVQPGRQALAYLLRGDRLINLGRPVVDQVLARGVQPGDEVCVLEFEAQRQGCKSIVTDDNQQLILNSLPNWQPDVRITPVTSRTMNVQVFNVASMASVVRARLYSINGFASPTVTLTYYSGGSYYSGTIALTRTILGAAVRVWTATPRQEVVAYYTLGTDPGNMWSEFGNMWSEFGNMRSEFGNMYSEFAPVLSGDGQVVLYSAGLHFAPGEFYALQAATHIPNPPPWASVVGKGYWLSRSTGAPSLVGPSISMGYAQNEVPLNEEAFLRVFFWNGASWVMLPTTLDQGGNLAVAPARGPGLYALMSTVEIPLYGPGWDVFAYPIQATQLVTQALQSIAGKYAIVYWYDGSDAADPWKVYAVNPPGWVNDLSVLKFGESYWISVTQAVTLQLGGGSEAAMMFPVGPPATYYGQVFASGSFTPVEGASLTAWIGGKQCGQGWTQRVNGQVMYTLNVFADGPGGASGCGDAGRPVMLQVGNQFMLPQVVWDNNQVWLVNLTPAQRVYLPIVLR